MVGLPLQLVETLTRDYTEKDKFLNALIASFQLMAK